MNRLNVLNKNESMILDLIDQIQDPIEKKKDYRKIYRTNQRSCLRREKTKIFESLFFTRGS